MKISYLVIGILAVMVASSCGGSGAGETGPGNVDVMRIAIAQYPAEAGYPVQMSVSVTLNDGEEIDGITTQFVDPLSGEEYELDWWTSHEGLATVDQYARLRPRNKGFVEVSARMGDVIRTRVVQIVNPDIPVIPPPEPDVIDDPETDPPEETDPDPVACRGFIEAVESYMLGAGGGYGETDLPDAVMGPPEGAGDTAGGGDVLSLGAWGEIIVDVDPCIIVDGPGVDFIVFENPFYIGGDPGTLFHELGEVAVSEDGTTFIEFFCNDMAHPYSGCAGWNPVYANSVNMIDPFDHVLAGGDPFDLADLGIQRVRYVRIRDVEAFDTGGGTAGFDLDALAVVNGEETP